MISLREKNNEVEKLLKNLATRLTKPEYENASNIIWALINGATFGIENTYSTSFIHEAEDIWFETKEVNKTTDKTYKTFELIKGGRDA